MLIRIGRTRLTPFLTSTKYTRYNLPLILAKFNSGKPKFAEDPWNPTPPPQDIKMANISSKILRKELESDPNVNIDVTNEDMELNELNNNRIETKKYINEEAPMNLRETDEDSKMDKTINTNPTNQQETSNEKLNNNDKINENTNIAANNNGQVQSKFELKERPDGIKFLLGEHVRLRTLFTDIQSTMDWNVKCNLVRDMINEIARHSSAEERYLYPLINTKMPKDEMLHDRMIMDNAIDHEVLSFLDKHSKLASTDDRLLFEITVNKFVTAELEHMQQEEEILLKCLADKLSLEEKEQLDNDLRWAKGNAPTHPHSLPQFGEKIIHPLAGMVDRILDDNQNAKLNVPPTTPKNILY